MSLSLAYTKGWPSLGDGMLPGPSASNKTRRPLGRSSVGLGCGSICLPRHRFMLPVCLYSPVLAVPFPAFLAPSGHPGLGAVFPSGPDFNGRVLQGGGSQSYLVAALRRRKGGVTGATRARLKGGPQPPPSPTPQMLRGVAWRGAGSLPHKWRTALRCQIGGPGTTALAGPNTPPLQAC